MLDVVTLGEAMIRLAPPNFARLEQAVHLDVQVGGSEYNVAVGVSRLGLRSGWVSRLPENPLGRLVRNKAREHGVSTDALVWAKSGRVGLYFLEFGAAPRASAVVYDRAYSACAEFREDEVDWDHVLEGVRAFYVSGIMPALSEGAARTTRRALQAARKAGCLVAYDLNYRKRLWTPEEAGRCQEPLMEYVDLLLTTEEDAHVVFGIKPEGADDANFNQVSGRSYESVAMRLQERFKIPTVAITLRENPLVWKNTWSAMLLHQGQYHYAPRYEVEVVDRVGAGDSFVAGLLSSYLTDGDWARALPFGVAFSALKHTIPGDVNWSTREEVERLLKGGNLRVSR